IQARVTLDGVVHSDRGGERKERPQTRRRFRKQNQRTVDSRFAARIPAAAETTSARALRFGENGSPLRGPPVVLEKPDCKTVRRVDVVKVIQVPPNKTGVQARPDELRQENVRQTDESVACK